MLPIRIAQLLITVSSVTLGGIYAYGGEPSVFLNSEDRMFDGQAPIKLSEKESQTLLAAIDRGRLRVDELIKKGQIGLGDLVAPYIIIIKQDDKERTHLLSSKMFFASKSVFLTDEERKWLHELFDSKGIRRPEQTGAAQPATKPADKVPAKVKPSTPTPKAGPR